MFSASRRRIHRIVLFACVLASYTVSSQDAAVLPEGDGRDLVAGQCINCHALSTVIVKRASAEDWSETVNRMTGVYMAPINEADRQRIVGYLSANFGRDAAGGSPGQQVVSEQCFRCHGEGMWKGIRADRKGWLSVIYRMVGQGGVWTPEQINAMADYFAATYPAEAAR